MITPDKPIRILIISDAWHPQVNGVVRTYEHLQDKLIKMGHHVDVIGPADFPITIPTPGYSEIRLALLTRSRLTKKIKSFAPDHIHIATEGPLGNTARKISLRHNIHFSTCYHTHFPDYIAKRVQKVAPFLAPLIRKAIFARIRKFHDSASVTFVATKSLERDLKHMKFKCVMYPLTRGVDTDVFHVAQKTLFNDMQQPIALYVGRIAIEKNIEAFLNMKWDGSKIIVGDGPSINTLKTQFPNAHFVGKKQGRELAAHYQSSDVFVFPSKTDTFGMVLIEAMACGLPLAGYNVTGPKDIITHPYLGAINNDLSKAAYTAVKLPDNDKRSQFAADNYSWQEAANQFITAIHETQ